MGRQTGFYYYRARYYDPKIGRFISEDPIGFRGGINFYAYVENNPVNDTDPTGLQACCPSGPVASAACYSRCVNDWLINPVVAGATAAAGAVTGPLNRWANRVVTPGGLTNAEVKGLRIAVDLWIKAGLITTAAEAQAAAQAGVVTVEPLAPLLPLLERVLFWAAY